MLKCPDDKVFAGMSPGMQFNTGQICPLDIKTQTDSLKSFALRNLFSHVGGLRERRQQRGRDDERPQR